MKKLLFALALLALAVPCHAAQVWSWNNTNMFKSPGFNPTMAATNSFTPSDSGTLGVGSGSVWTYDPNYAGLEDADHVFVTNFLGAMTRTISRGTNLWALTGGTLAPSVAQTTLRATNIQSHDNLTAMGGFTFNLGTNIVMPPGSNTVPVANAISRYSYVWLTSDANTTDPTLRTAYLGVPTVRGGWLVVENYTNGIIAQSAFQMTNQAPLVGALLPWQTLTLINGDWKPTRGGESLLLQTDGRGWREVARWWGAAGTVQTNLLGIINPTDLYHPYRQGSNQFGDSYIVRLANEEYVTNASLRVAHQGTFNDDGGAGQTFTTYGQNKNSAFQVLDDYAQLEYNIQAIIGTNDPTATHGLSLYNYAMSDPSVAYEAENSLSLNWLGSAWSTNQALSHLTRWSAWGKGVAAADDPTTTWVLESQIAALAPTTNLTVDADSKTYAHLGSLAITRNDTDFAGFGITPGGNAFIQTTNGGNAIDLFNTTYANTISPHDDDTYSLGAVHSAGSWLYSLARTNLVKSYDEGISTTNYVWMGVSMNNKQAIFDIQSETNDVLGPVTGYSFRTNGVELFSITGTGGPSSGANWVASGTTNSTLAGTATIGGAALITYDDANGNMGVGLDEPISGRYNTRFGKWSFQGGLNDYNTSFGIYSGYGSTNNENTFFGAYAGYGNTGLRNTFMGMYAGGYCAGMYNTGIGCYSMQDGGTNSWNWASGVSTLARLKVGDKNSAGGHGAIQNLLQGNENTGLGNQAAFYLTNGFSNIFIGAFCGTNVQNGQRSMFIGHSAGPATSTAITNKLYIDMAKRDDPLIGGDFASRYITFNGNVGILYDGATQPLEVEANDAGEGIKLRYGGATVGQWARKSGASAPGTFALYNANAVANYFDALGASYINGGNLGIGTNAPSEKLEVFGNIRIDKGNLLGGYTNVLVSATGKDFFYVSVPNTNGIGGHVVYTVFGTDGTDVQEISGDCKFAAVAKVTTVTATLADVQGPAALTGGSTLTAVLAANVTTNNVFALGVTATTSLTTTNLVIKWRVETPSTFTVNALP